jgi:predicted dehydrogenase
VYIALPNSLHAEYTVRALQRGIHVLCEKPLALTEADCRRMVEAAEESGAKLMTAYRLHFEEANLKAIRLAREKLGNLRYFSSTFSFQIRDRDNIRLEAKEGGSPLWDLGVYCINAARYFFRDEPLAVMAIGANGGGARFREVQEMSSVLMKFPGERMANFTCSFGAGDSAAYDVVGEKGRLHMEAAYEYAFPREMVLTVGEKKQKLRFKKVDQFAPELLYFAQCIRQNRSPEPSGLEGWADVRIIRAIEQSMKSGRAVMLPATPRKLAGKARPSFDQWIERPPVKEPEVLRADAPGGD